MARKPKPRDPAREAIDFALHRLREHFPAAVVIVARTDAELAESGPLPPRIEFSGDTGSCAGILWHAYENMEEAGLPMPEDDADDEGADK